MHEESPFCRNGKDCGMKRCMFYHGPRESFLEVYRNEESMRSGMGQSVERDEGILRKIVGRYEEEERRDSDGIENLENNKGEMSKVRESVYVDGSKKNWAEYEQEDEGVELMGDRRRNENGKERL